MNTTTVRNPKVIRTEHADISIVTVEQAFDNFMAYLEVNFEDEFVKVNNQLGKLFDENNNLLMKVYIYDVDHNGTDEMVVEAHTIEAQDEVDTTAWRWHNLVVS
jgi:hypothetical protein